MEQEVWRPVVGHETSHEVSNLGRVRSVSRETRVTMRQRWGVTSQRRVITGKVLKPQRRNGKHLAVSIGGRSIYVHHMVAAAFIGPRPKGFQVLHDDDDWDNNTRKNIKYGTPAHNAHDTYRNGRRPMGRNTRGGRDLTKREVAAIKALRGRVRRFLVARAFNRSVGCIAGIWNGKSWRHVAPGDLAAALKLYATFCADPDLLSPGY